MRTCEKHGDCVVVWECGACPACDEIADKDREIVDLKDQVKELEDEITEAKNG